jgi:hypothetical protein
MMIMAKDKVFSFLSYRPETFLMNPEAIHPAEFRLKSKI